MFIVNNYTTAVLLCIITMFCWGSWANTQKLAGRSWRFELFYWDYVLGILLFSLLFGHTLGAVGSEGRHFIDDLHQASWNNFLSAALGGVIFNAANILLAAAIAVAGMAVAFPIGIGMALVLGVVINFAADQRGNPFWLFAGVAAIILAILLNASAYRRSTSSARAPGGGKKVTTKGILLAVSAGILMSFFYRFVAASMDLDNFAHPAPGKLTPYTAMYVFALGIFVSNFVFNTLFMRRPVSGRPVSYKEYFAGPWKTHLVGLLGGLIWGLGNGLNLVASGKAGPAISYGLGQGATLVAAAWGVFVWKEFAPATRATRRLIAGMFIFFLCGIGMIVYAGRLEPPKQQQVAIIFDSDIGPDYDDVGAITILHALADSGQAKILATMASNKYEGIAAVLNVFNTYFRRPGIPIGVPAGAGVNLRDSQHWTDSILAKYPHTIRTNKEAEDAVTLYRKILSRQPDTSVTIVTVGFLTNLSNLLRSAPDSYSSLDGAALVKRKVRRLVSMAGSFPQGREFNVYMDSAASQYVFENWPTAIFFSGFQIGEKIKCGLPLIHNPDIQNSPVKDVFRISIPLAREDSAGRSSWDETAVLIAIKGYWPWYALHRGTIHVKPDGSDFWEPSDEGRHFYIQETRPPAEVQAVINTLIQHQPK
ncbi:MAG TPA: nucleoside hydrolase [Puia sp.]|nr:nucleoside hydrolase [Puia sp.]